jgi:hypothetical protein
LGVRPRGRSAAIRRYEQVEGKNDGHDRGERDDDATENR